MESNKGVKRKLDVKSVDFKYRAIMEVERGRKSKSKIASDLGIKLNTLSTWIKNKETITCVSRVSFSLNFNKTIEN